LMIGAAGLVVPQYLNGMRTRWNPSELKLKGDALAVAEAAAAWVGGDLDPVPLLALRQGA
ncbi:MAG: hypothetical protein GWO02_13820, partial [Gammaproteobacteria bacterium]|nr:hypothetical protein [Gammaproteobacteria bacterium]